MNISKKKLLTLWNWIPQRLTVYKPSVLFTTQEHGTSITTLFNVLDELELCILLVRTFQNEVNKIGVETIFFLNEIQLLKISKLILNKKDFWRFLRGFMERAQRESYLFW